MKSVSHLIITIADLELNAEKILSTIYKNIQADEIIKAAFDEIFLEAQKKIIINADIEITTDFQISDTLILKNKIFHTGDKVKSGIYSAEKLILFTCSIEELPAEKDVNTKQELNLETYFLDLIKNVAISKSIDHIRLKIKNSIKPFKISDAFCPGNCDWAFNDLPSLLSICPVFTSKITISESNLMTPLKSQCGIFAVGANIKFKKMTCFTCSSKNCIYRKIKSLSKKNENTPQISVDNPF
jgi:hypothetical protein